MTKTTKWNFEQINRAIAMVTKGLLVCYNCGATADRSEAAQEDWSYIKNKGFMCGFCNSNPSEVRVVPK